MNHSKEYVLSQLRHAYMHLKSGTVNRQAKFADGLLAPAIRYLEETGDSPERDWQSIETAPTLERVYVAGWQKRSGTCAAYWWHGEDTTDENGKPMGHPDAVLWRPLPEPPTQPPHLIR